ncbi:MAG: alpha/beta hydrolase [Chloroflexota bacterium]
MSVKKAQTIPVLGANLYYEVRGSGPILLMIAAGAGDADSFGSAIEHLIDHYTVVTYDRRGLARSPLDYPNQPIEIETHSEDAHCLLAELTSEAVYVFGSSIGAVIGIDLAIRHANQVRRLVAHEPPLLALLSDAEQQQAMNERVHLEETLHREGTTAAFQQFITNLGISHDDPPISRDRTQQDVERIQKNHETFFKYDAGAVERYKPNIVTLQTLSTRIVPAGGLTSHETGPYRCAVALADLLTTPIVEFPGSHAGFVDYPQEFAKTLHVALRD